MSHAYVFFEWKYFLYITKLEKKQAEKEKKIPL